MVNQRLPDGENSFRQIYEKFSLSRSNPFVCDSSSRMQFYQYKFFSQAFQNVMWNHTLHLCQITKIKLGCWLASTLSFLQCLFSSFCLYTYLKAERPQEMRFSTQTAHFSEHMFCVAPMCSFLHCLQHYNKLIWHWKLLYFIHNHDDQRQTKIPAGNKEQMYLMWVNVPKMPYQF